VQKPLNPAVIREQCQSYWEWLARLFLFRKQDSSVPKQREPEYGTSQSLSAPDQETSVFRQRITKPLSGHDLTVNPEQLTTGPLSVDEDEVTDEDVVHARAQVRKIAQQLVSSLSRNRKHSKVKRQIDFRRSLRRSIQTGGILIDLKYKDRVIKKPRLVIILDTSGSMQVWIKMLIQLIQAVGLELSKKEIFIFAQDLECVTRDLRKTWQETVSVMQHRENWGGTTSIFHALRTLQEEHHDKLSFQSVVLMLSDLFTAEPEKSSEEVKKICRRSKGFYIFRTVDDEEDRVFYDNYVRPFIGAATAVYNVKNLRDMAEAVRKVCLR